jgi:hypothetical protein
MPPITLANGTFIFVSAFCMCGIVRPASLTRTHHLTTPRSARFPSVPAAGLLKLHTYALVRDSRAAQDVIQRDPVHRPKAWGC